MSPRSTLVMLRLHWTHYVPPQSPWASLSHVSAISEEAWLPHLPPTTVVSDSPGVRTPFQHGSHYAYRSSRKKLWHSDSTRADQEALGQDINVLPFLSTTDCLETQWFHIASLRHSASPSNLEPGCIPGIYGQLSASHAIFTFISLPHSLFSSFLLSWDCTPQ